MDIHLANIPRISLQYSIQQACTAHTILQISLGYIRTFLKTV
jgi:hypothetical protein